ncbi:MAG: CHASE domain-containing protein [Sphingomonadales bacterium]|nr:CHASE domain-containing protein [Sphingomonadales bacterium]
MDKALLERVSKQAWFHRFPRALPLALFSLGLLATALFIAKFEQLDRTARRAQLDMQASDLSNELQYKAGENAVYLNAAASPFSASLEVRRDELDSLILDMGERANERGVLGVGWVRWIRANEAPRFEREQRALAGDDGFSVHPAPTSPFAEMAVIATLAPSTPTNRAVIGYDMYSEPVRRAALDAAISSGKAAVSGKVHLLQDADRPGAAGFLIYVPVFQREGSGRNWTKGPLKGFVYSPIRANEFLKTALRRVPHEHISVRIYDGPATPANLLAAADSNSGDVVETLSRPVQIGDRTWTLTVSSVEPRMLSPSSRLTLLFGLIVSLLILALSWLFTARATEDRKVLEWLTAQSGIRLSLTRELNHRVKNTLANVLSIVSLTRRRSRDIDEFSEGLTGRIRALSATHDLLAQRDWNDAPLRDVVTSELAPYLDPDDPHADVDGPDIALAPNDALSLGLALHELATNAAKYGALSSPDGRVSVRWALAEPGVCDVEWREIGGPEVTPPARRGFGLDLIEKIVAHELKASVDLQFGKSGVFCRLKVPVRDSGEFALRQPRSG